MANNYDRIFKENIEPLQLPLIKKLLGLDPPKLIPFDAKLQVTQEREMDNIKIVAHEDPVLNYGLQIEVHLPDEDLRPRNLLHYSLFYHITRLPLRQIVIYIGMAHPQQIVKNRLELLGLYCGFEVIVLKDIPKEIFLNSQIPEEVVLAILCDYGQDKPVEVVRQILLNLKKILKKTDKIRKYQKQLVVLSRLRKIETITKTEVEAMTIHYDIETDGLYLEGIEKGRAVEATAKERDFTLKLWALQEFPLEKIAMLVGVTQQQVTDTIVNHLTEAGKTKEEALAIVENYRP